MDYREKVQLKILAVSVIERNNCGSKIVCFFYEAIENDKELVAEMLESLATQDRLCSCLSLNLLFQVRTFKRIIHPSISEVLGVSTDAKSSGSTSRIRNDKGDGLPART